MHQIWRLIVFMLPSFVRIHLIYVKILKAFRLGKKVANKCRPLLVQFEKENAKAKILGKSYLLKSVEPYSDVYVSVDMTKSERIKHKQLVEELKSRRAKDKTNIFICSNN